MSFSLLRATFRAVRKFRKARVIRPDWYDSRENTYLEYNRIGSVHRCICTSIIQHASQNSICVVCCFLHIYPMSTPFGKSSETYRVRGIYKSRVVRDIYYNICYKLFIMLITIRVYDSVRIIRDINYTRVAVLVGKKNAFNHGLKVITKVVRAIIRLMYFDISLNTTIKII